MRKTILIITILIVMLMTGCSLDVESPEIGDIQEGVDYFIFDNAGVSLPLTGFKTLNPLFIDNLSYYHFSKLIFEGLFEYDEYLQPVPRLASTYTISEDGRTVQVSLRPDILWHSGDRLVAEDVVFTVGIMKQAGMDSFYGKTIRSGTGFGDMSFISAKALSESRVEINLKEPLGNVLDLLTFPIIPRSMGSSALAMEDYIPNGTGPYRFVEYLKFKEVHLESNEYYRDGEPQISYITGKIFDDSELILTAFETGKLSAAPTMGVDWDKYEHNERITIYEYVSGNYETIVFNHQNSLFAADNGKNIKQAIMYGVDRQSIIEKVYLQHGTQVDVPVHPSSYLSDKNVYKYGYNRENAASILKSSGFTDLDGDGILEDLEGNNLVLELLVNPTSDLKQKSAEMIRTNLLEIGIGIQITNPSGQSPEERAINMEHMLNEGDFDISLVEWEQSAIPRFDSILSKDAIGSGNISFYTDDGMEEILGRVAVTWEEAERVRSFKEFQEYLAENLPYGSILFRNKALLVDSGIVGPLEPNYYNLYKGLEKCYLTMSTK